MKKAICAGLIFLGGVLGFSLMCQTTVSFAMGGEGLGQLIFAGIALVGLILLFVEYARANKEDKDTKQ